MLKLKTVLLIFIPVMIACLVVGYFVWNKPKQNIENANAIEVNATSLFSEFSENEQAATVKYNGKILLVTGNVSTVSKNLQGKTIVQLQTTDFLFGVNCTLEKEVEIEVGTKITLKGVCSGFTSDVILIRCYLLKKIT